jgi:hypothetical protein
MPAGRLKLYPRIEGSVCGKGAAMPGETGCPLPPRSSSKDARGDEFYFILS